MISNTRTHYHKHEFSCLMDSGTIISYIHVRCDRWSLLKLVCFNSVLDASLEVAGDIVEPGLLFVLRASRNHEALETFPVWSDHICLGTMMWKSHNYEAFIFMKHLHSTVTCIYRHLCSVFNDKSKLWKSTFKRTKCWGQNGETF